MTGYQVLIQKTYRYEKIIKNKEDNDVCGLEDDDVCGLEDNDVCRLEDGNELNLEFTFDWNIRIEGFP